MSHKASLSRSPLAKPGAVVYQLASEVQEWLYMPDPSPLYIVLGVLAANMIKGPAVWLMLIGPSGCGKTELLMSLLGIPGIFDASHITGPAALLSGTGKKDISKGATGGLLREIGDHGALVIDDFTSAVLSMGYEDRQEVLGAFRTAFYGRWSRILGTDGGRRLVWEGRLAMLTGGTPVIERYHAEIADFGERWIYYRYRLRSGWGESRSALISKDPIRGRIILREAIRSFMDVMELRWNTKEVDYEKPRRVWTASEYTRLIAMAGLAAKMRSGTVRDIQKKEIIAIPQPEAPQRLAVTLGQLWMGLAAIGLEPDQCWQLVERVAWDSVPMLASGMVKALWKAKGTEKDIDDLRKMTGCGAGTVIRAVEDLEAHGLVTREKKLLKLTQYALEEMHKAGGDQG